MIVKKINFFNTPIKLYNPEEYQKESNLISILVGKNSSGKSTALAEIINQQLNTPDTSFRQKQLDKAYVLWGKQHRSAIKEIFNLFDVDVSLLYKKGRLAKNILLLIEDEIETPDINELPNISQILFDIIKYWHQYEQEKKEILQVSSQISSKTIAITNTVYNRFPEAYDNSIYFRVCPSKRQFNKIVNYRLDTLPDITKLLINCFDIFGIRLEIPTPVYEDFNSIWDYFLRQLDKDSGLESNLASVLNFLDCKNSNIMFSMSISREITRYGSQKHIKSILEYIAKQLIPYSIANQFYSEICKHIYAFEHVLYLFERCESNILELSLNELLNEPQLLHSLSIAIEIGFITTTEIYIPEKNSKHHYQTSRMIEDLSSGEMSFLTLGVLLISAVEDNAVICIDEPEINLHPEWQEKLLKFFDIILQKNTGIHLIIATHSPQLISNLPEKNAFIVNLTTKETSSAKSSINKSADFQLTEIFQSPGNNNEYLLRKLLILLEKINNVNNQSLNEKDYEFIKELKNLQAHGVFSPDDKVLIIFNSILDMLQILEVKYDSFS